MATATSYGSGATVIEGSFNNTANAYDSSLTTYAETVAGSALGFQTLDITGYDFSGVISASATINSVTIQYQQFHGHNARWILQIMTAWDGSTQLTFGGSDWYVPTERTSAGSDTFIAGTDGPAITLANLRSGNLKFRVSDEKTSNTGNTIWSVGGVLVTVDYTEPNATVTGLTTVAGTASAAAPGLTMVEQAATVAGVATVGSPTVSCSAFACPGGPGVNFLRAASQFDGNITGWVANGSGATPSYDATEGHNTLGSLKVVQTTGDDTVQSPVRTAYDHQFRGDTKVYSLWIKTTVADTVTLMMRRGIGGSLNEQQPTLTPGVWTKVNYTLTNPDWLTDIAVAVRTTVADTYWIDDVMLEYKSAEPGSDWVLNTAVPCFASIGSPTVTTSSGGTDATVTGLTTVAAVASAAAPGLTMVEQAATVAATTTVGAPNLFMVEQATTVAATTTVAAPGLSMVEQPTTVASTTAVGSPTLVASVTITTTTVAATTTAAAPGLTMVEQPTTVTATTTVGTPSLFMVEQATTVAATTTVAAPGLTMVEQPDTVAASASVGTVTVTAQSSATVSVSTVDAVAVVPMPEVSLFTRPYGRQTLLIA